VFEAQGYIISVWNCSQLFDTAIDSKVKGDKLAEFLLLYLRHMVVPKNESIAQEVNQAKTIELLEYIDNLRLSKFEETKKQAYFDKLFGDERPEFIF
jgi:hypothetical protein